MTQIIDNIAALPQGWAWTTLGDLALAINPGFPSGKWQRREEKCIPHLRPMNIDIKGSINLSEVKYVLSQNTEPLKKGDILFNNTNSPKLIGKTTYIKEDTNWAYSNHMTRIKVHPFINPGYVSHYLHHLFLRGFFLSNCLHHVNQASVNSTFLRDKVPLPLAPSLEQARIVCKIEELFSFLDAGTASLLKVHAQLKRYRQAALKYAFEGKLTEQWRETHKNHIEPAKELLDLIRKNKGNNLEKTWPSLDTDSLHAIPESWAWVRLGEISNLLQYGTSEKTNSDQSGIPIVRMGNIQNGRIEFKDLKYLSKDTPHLSDLVLNDGDILFNRTNSAELVGKTAVYKKNYPISAFASYLIRVKLNANTSNSDIIAYYINSYYGRKYIASVVSQQVGQANVNGTKLSLMPIPLLPKLEQEKLVDELERLFSIIGETEKSMIADLRQSELLRQSILKEAFAGKLIPQDPDDEPAQRLLDHIKDKRNNNRSSKNNNQIELTHFVK